MLRNSSRYQHAQRSADPGKRANDTLSQVKPAGPVREVRNNKRSQHTQRRTAESVQRLNDDKPSRVSRQSKKSGAYRHRCKSKQQERSTSPRRRSASRPRRQQCNNDLRNHDQCGHRQRGPMPFRMRQWFADLRKNRSVRELKEKEASCKGKKADVFEERLTADPIGLRLMMIGSATGPAEVNICAVYPEKCP